MGERWWRITGDQRGGGQITAGIRVLDGVVVETAPIFKRLRGKWWPSVKAALAETGYHGAPL